jgi:hypothetical protein
VLPVRYEVGFYIPEDGILRSHRRENLKSYTVLKFAMVTLQKRLLLTSRCVLFVRSA